MPGINQAPKTYLDRKLAAVCVRALCGHDAADDSDLCTTHRDEKRARDREAKQARRSRKRRCIRCGAQTRKRRCKRCRRLHADTVARSRGVVTTDDKRGTRPARRGVASAQAVKVFETRSDLDLALKEMERAVVEVRRLDAAGLPAHRLADAMSEPLARLELVRRTIAGILPRHHWKPFTASAGAEGPSRPIGGGRKRRAVPSPHRRRRARRGENNQQRSTE
jgi:hypothetical protein